MILAQIAKEVGGATFLATGYPINLKFFHMEVVGFVDPTGNLAIGIKLSPQDMLLTRRNRVRYK